MISTLSENDRALLFSLASLQSYQPPTEFLNPREGVTSLTPINPYIKYSRHSPTLIEVLGAKAYVISDSHDVIVVCRGTEDDLPETLSKLQVSTVRHRGGGLCHAGFYAEYSKVMYGIRQAIRSHDPRNKKNIWLTGHSLGGAMAVLISIDLNPSGCYTFGQPRVGNRRLLKQINFPYYRYKNCNDIVTIVPFKMLGYSDAGECRYMDINGDFIKFGFIQRIRDLSKGIWSSIMNGERFDFLQDHRMKKYHTYIEKAGKNEPINPQ